MLQTDLALANLLQQQYDGVAGIFDYETRISEVSFAVKEFDEEVVIFFEGTYNLPDWISNFHAQMISVKNMGRVEYGFYFGLCDVLNDIQARLSKDDGKQITVTGHSRGAGHANIFSVMLSQAGYQKVRRVTFASPRPGDADFIRLLQAIPGQTYRNYRDEEEQDFICDVPFHFMLLPYERPMPCITIDVAPMPNDPWLLFSRHHLSLYIKGISEIHNQGEEK